MAESPAEAPPDVGVKPGDMLAGKYKIDRVIGQGGMGVVVLATHVVLNDKVAIKFLLPDVLRAPSVAARFLREAQSAVRIKSPHVARVLDVGTLDSGSPYMVMEFLEGRDLSDVIRDQGALEIEVACVFALQACEALGAAHVAGIVHRDIKPANLFLTHGGDGAPVLKMLDFGISKSAGMEGSAALTQTQTAMGSPLYMSPEQMRSARDVDVRTDIWSLGVVLYEMLTGALPFVADSMPQLCALILENDAPLVTLLRPDCPPALAEVVAMCLKKKPADRLASVADLAEGLAPFAGDFGYASAGRVGRIVGGAARTNLPPRQGSLPAMSKSGLLGEVVGKTGTDFGRTDGKPKLETLPPPPAPAPRNFVAIAFGIGLPAIGLGIFLAFRGSGGADTKPPTSAVADRPVAIPLVAANPAPLPEPAKSIEVAPAASSAPSVPDVKAPAAGGKKLGGPLPRADKPEEKKPPAAQVGIYDDRK